VGSEAAVNAESFFDGSIDALSLVSQVKTAAEILDDATLVLYCSFDYNDFIDDGPLSMSMMGGNYSWFEFGDQNRAITLSSASSLVQTSGFTRLGRSTWPYSFALWINPTNVSIGPIIHLSATFNQTWCFSLLGLDNTSRLIVNSWNGTATPFLGPIIGHYRWTHVAVTYSPLMGQSVYINGSHVASSTQFVYQSPNAMVTLTLGGRPNSMSTCPGDTIPEGRYDGYIDELRVYARQITFEEIMQLSRF
jgi:hypothetical protein